ncbi:peptidoglycan-binding domain-containing protein [Halalkalibacterium ligniniphilum]|nr:peptidoglycan-binding domain-containing protein [Halalkalibacterium ligniniphilum]
MSTGYADGIFGTRTYAAVTHQRSSGITVDGIAGSQTTMR